VRRSMLLVPVALAVLLITAPGAAGGGFATAGLSSTPEGIAAGTPWSVDITVLQHGRTPLDGLTPKVRIRSGDTTRQFIARPTGRPGVYRAEVVFPAAGRWSYEVLDGFIDATPHTFPAVDIAGGGTAPARADGGIAAGWLWGAGAALALALAVVGVDRRRRSPAHAGAPEPA
jgi:hypothetical protein